MKFFEHCPAAGLLFAGVAFAVDPSPSYLDPKQGEGCWVQFFDEREFARPMGRLAGNLYLNSTAGPGLIGRMSDEEFLRRAQSLIVGPEANLIAYAEPGFDREIVRFEAGRKVPALREAGFPEKVASLKIACVH